MSTMKKDAVIEALEAYLESHPDSDAAKLMLYANPNGSGLLGDTPKGLPALAHKVDELNRTGVFNPEGLQLPLASLGIEARLRHTIDELLLRIEIANLMRAHIYVAHTKGVEWPAKKIDLTGMTVDAKPAYSIKIPTVKAIKAAAKDELVGKLPTIVGICYAAKYKSSSTFSYNLAETKFYTLNSAFLMKALQWVGKSLGLITVSVNAAGAEVMAPTAGAGDASMFAAVLGGVEDSARARLVFEEWFKYSYNKPKDSHSYPASYEKLARAITARIGKLLFASTSDADYSESGIAAARACLGELQFTEAILKDKKKDLQLKVCDKILSFVRDSYAVAAQSGYTVGTVEHASAVRSAISGAIGAFMRWLAPLGIESALVSTDVYATGKHFYSRNDFYSVMQAFSQTGVCNDRVINAIYKFISTASLLANDHSRKKIDESIELVLAEQGDLSKIKTENTEEPSIVFSAAALAKMPHEQRVRFEHLHDKKGYTGYVQKGVMSITSSLKVDKDSFTLPTGLNADQVRLLANELDEMANIYHLYAEPTFNARKKETAARESHVKMLKKHGVTSAGSPQMQQAPAFVPVSVSPQQVVQSSVFGAAPIDSVPMFGAPADHHHTEHHVAHHKPPSPVQVAAPQGLFGAAPASPSQQQASSLFGGVKSASPSPSRQASSSLFATTGGSPPQLGANSLFGGSASPAKVNGGGLFGTGSV